MHRFCWHLISEILSSIGNDYKDNFDFYRFGQAESSGGQSGLQSSGMLRAIKKLKHIFIMFELLKVYKGYADDESRNLLIKLLAYRLLGPRKVSLPLNTPAYWQGIERINGTAVLHDNIRTAFQGWTLSRFKLQALGYPIEIYHVPQELHAIFCLRQYDCPQDKRLRAARGDCVIDAGGFWGGSALFFAEAVGDEGRVLAFEFVHENLAIMKRNISMNAALAKRIEIIERPLWSREGQFFNYLEDGPGSRLAPTLDQGRPTQCATTTIDHYVGVEHFDKVDFIKMDIEGAELEALHGAEETMKKYRPKLAISVYHSLRDLVEIQAYLGSLDLGYSFYLGHFTIHHEETILFAGAGTMFADAGCDPRRG